jgi:hypothetical protein
MPDNLDILEPDAGLGFTDRVSACVRRNSRGKMVQASMTFFRRPLASCALVVLLLQVAGLIAAPVSACCRAANAAVPAACCKPVQHQAGPCPMHPAENSRPDRCRFTHDTRGDAPLLLGLFAPLPAVPTIAVPIVAGRAAMPATPWFVSRTSIPDSPPPKSRV